MLLFSKASFPITDIDPTYKPGLLITRKTSSLAVKALNAPYALFTLIHRLLTKSPLANTTPYGKTDVLCRILTFTKRPSLVEPIIGIIFFVPGMNIPC